MPQHVVPTDEDREPIAKAEDAAHSSGDKGIMALAVRQDIAAALTGTDSDYAPLSVDATNKLWVHAQNTPLFSVATVTTGAIALATNPAGIWRLLSVSLHLSAAATSSESFTVKLDAGDGDMYDTLLFTQDLLVGSVVDLVIPFGEGYEYEADDDVDIDFPNGTAATYGVRVAYELL